MAGSRLPSRPDLLLKPFFTPSRSFRRQFKRSLSASSRNAGNVPKGVFTRYPSPTLYDPASIPSAQLVLDAPSSLLQVSTVPSHIHDPSALVTLYEFPTFTPVSFLEYPSTHLHLPLRRDILHRAVIFEGDAERQGTASTKWRSEVHGSGRKIRPQKGSGRARLGDRKSPMLRGGGAAHGPKPRDFSTKLPKKIYDLGWRTALSYRYRKGELVVVEDLCKTAWESMTMTQYAAMSEAFRERQLEPQTDWRGNPETKSTVWVLDGEVTDKRFHKAHRALWKFWPKDKVKSTDTLDVKNLLEGGRVVIEKAALDRILIKHQSDLRPAIDITKARAETATDADKMKAAVRQMTNPASVAAITTSLSELVMSVEEETGKAIKETKILLDSHNH